MSTAQRMPDYVRDAWYLAQTGTRLTSAQRRRLNHKDSGWPNNPIGKGRPTPRQRDQVAKRKGRGPITPERTNT